MTIEIPDERDDWGNQSLYEGDSSSEGDDPSEDTLLESAAEVSCPYCGASVTLTIDPAGGSRQKYVEDCEVCCQPWSVVVQFDGWGNAEVQVDQAY